MDLKLFRLLLPVFVTLGIVITQELDERIRQRCENMAPGTPVGFSDDCRRYTICPDEGHMRHSRIQDCAPGTLFDTLTGVCDFADRVDCDGLGSTDPCLGLADGFHEDSARSRENQGAVLVCEGGRTIGGGFCPECERYGNVETGCVVIPQCVFNPVQYDCPLSPSQNSPAQYIANDAAGTVMNCGNGTVFSQEACACV